MPQVTTERLYLKEPRTDRLRRSAAGQLRHLLATGWRETDRSYSTDYVAVRLEHEGSPATPIRTPAPPPRPARRGPDTGARRGR